MNSAQSMNPDLAASGDMTAELHRHLHWCTLRAICRNPRLGPDERRAKLRFVIAGLARSHTWPNTLARSA